MFTLEELNLLLECVGAYISEWGCFSVPMKYEREMEEKLKRMIEDEEKVRGREQNQEGDISARVRGDGARCTE